MLRYTDVSTEAAMKCSNIWKLPPFTLDAPVAAKEQSPSSACISSTFCHVV